MPSRRPDTAQQRLWLGANRYSSGCRNPGTNTKCLAYSCIKRYPLRGYESDSDANCNSNGYRYPNCDGNTHRNGHGYSYSNAQTDAHAQVCADTEASSHTRAQTVTVFAKANIVASGEK
jgi:hypothetical protein